MDVPASGRAASDDDGRKSMPADGLDRFRAHAAEHPDAVAVVCHRAHVPLPQTMSYGQLSRLTDRLAAALLHLGVERGEVVSYQLPNSWEFTALTLACGRIGAVANPIAPVLRDREVSFILNRVASRVCVAPGQFRGFDNAQLLADIAGRGGPLEHLFAVSPGTVPPGVRGFHEELCAPRWEDRVAASDLDSRSPHPDDLAQIQFTSGTTGEPKGVMHTHRTLDAGVRSAVHAHELSGDDIVLMASTMAHQTGYLYGALMPVFHGMKAVYQDVWDPAVMLDLIDDERVTWTMGATPFVIDAVAAAKAGSRARDLSSLRIFATAGAPVPPHLIDAVRDHLGTELHTIWGMTENAAVTFTRPGDSPERRASSDGRPIDWMELQVVNDADEPLAPDEVGHLRARGANMCIGYFRRPDLWETTHDEEGWFRTGDLARMDANGYVRITGRAKDLIIRGGENVPVLEIESALHRHPRIRDVAIVGYPDERLGERACAAIVADGQPPTLDDLRDHLASEGMAKQYWPERVEIVQELPKSPAGKTQKYVLRDQLGLRAEE